MTIPQDWQRLDGGLRVMLRGKLPITQIQIFGQRCSGTNVVAQTIATNCPGAPVTDALGHKHWFVPHQTVFPEESLTIVVARDAFDWARSLHRQPWHAHPELKAQPFPTFLRSEWYSCWDEHVHHIEPGHPLLGTEMLHERDPETGERFRNCIAKRTAKLRHWAALPARAHNVALVAYDSFVRSPQRFIDALSSATELERTAVFEPVSSYKGQGHAPYTPQRYEALSETDADFIESWLDPAVEDQFGLSARHAPPTIAERAAA